jgi:hypothetical protein
MVDEGFFNPWCVGPSGLCILFLSLLPGPYGPRQRLCRPFGPENQLGLEPLFGCSKPGGLTDPMPVVITTGKRPPYEALSPKG